MAIKILHSTAMVMTIFVLLLLLSTSDAWDNSPPECQYPCLPPPVTSCPPPPPSVPSPPVSGYPPPSPSSPYFPYPPPFGFPAPPPPNPITPWFPWYYKTPPASSAVAVDGGLGFLAFMLAMSIGFLLQ